MRPRITGATLPVLEIGLEPGEMIIAQPGELARMTANVRMNETTATAGASGLWGALTRAVSGGGLFMTEFTAEGGPGGVAFTPKIPGQIVPVEVQAGRGFMAHRQPRARPGAYLGKSEPASTVQAVEAGAAGAILRGIFGGNREVTAGRIRQGSRCGRGRVTRCPRVSRTTIMAEG